MQAKKSLGQNFLKSQKAISDTVRAAQISPGETVLEIGPGRGALTGALLTAGAKVLAVETDRELVAHLLEKFAREIKENSLVLVHGDILDFNPKNYKLKAGGYKLVANIPYYITGAILRKFLESPSSPKSMTLIVQKEVGERIVAKDGKESILSLSVKIFGWPKLVSKIPKRYFSPEPQVDSAIVHIDEISKKRLGKTLLEKFFQVVKAGFAHKRKMLLGNLVSAGFAKDRAVLALEKAGLAKTARAEDVPLSTWISLSQKLL